MKLTMEAAYKQIRNKLRKLSPQSVVAEVLNLLEEVSGKDNLSDVSKAPWLLLLIVKWALQDRMAGTQSDRSATSQDIRDLAQVLWELPGKLRQTPEVHLMMRQVLRSQLLFQQLYLSGIIREAAVLLNVPSAQSIRRVFQERTGVSVEAFIDLSLVLLGLLIKEKKRATLVTSLDCYRDHYGDDAIESFLNLISRDFEGLTEYLQSLPDATNKKPIELFEFPVQSRFPYLRSNGMIICWTPMVAFHGFANIIHSALCEISQKQAKSFGSAFEDYVGMLLETINPTVYSEGKLNNYIPEDQKVTDFLIARPSCNIFVEVKSGVFGEKLMSTGDSAILQNRLSSINRAIEQGWSSSHGLRANSETPELIRKATVDYLLIVTNKELMVGRATRLEKLYGEKILPPGGYKEHRLPLENIYVVSIDDFERMIIAESKGELDLPEFLADCVQADADASTATFLIEQHLSSRGIPQRASEIVRTELDRAIARTQQILAS